MAVQLDRMGHSVSVIDRSSDSFRRLPSDFNGRKVKGVGYDRDALEQAGIDEAYAFVAVSNGDNSNIVAARVARESFGVDNVVARIYDSRRADVYERLGIPTVATVRQTADQMMRRILPSSSARELEDPSGTVALIQPSASPQWVGTTIGALEDRLRVRVAWISRDATALLPEAVTVIQEHDRLHLAVSTDRIGQVRRALSHAPTQEALAMQIVIAGAGSVGRSIARELISHGHEVTLVDRSTEAMRIASVPQADWQLADACDIDALERAGAETCDVIVAATGDDKANLVISLLAKTEYGVPRTVARVNNPKSEWLFDETWGVDVAVSTPRFMTALVEEAVSVGSLVSIFHFHQSGASMHELTLPEDSPVIGELVTDIELPPHTVLAAILRDYRPITPDRDERFERGDELIFLTAREGESSLKDLPLIFT